jgi:hypothetical protein
MLHENYKPLDEKMIISLQMQIADWKKQYDPKGGIRIIEVDGEEDEDKFEGIFKVPEKTDLAAATREGLTEMESNEQLCMLCVLYPEPILFKEILDKNFGLVTPITKKLLKISRVTTEARAKKL